MGGCERGLKGGNVPIEFEGSTFSGEVKSLDGCAEVILVLDVEAAKDCSLSDASLMLMHPVATESTCR